MKSGKISSILIALFFCVLMPISAAAYTDDFYATDTKWNNLTNLNSLERGGSLDVHTKIVNASGRTQMVNLIAGYYDDDGRFVECQMYEIEVPEGEQAVDHSFVWNDVLLSANSEAKFFVFAENIRPLCDAVSLKYENKFGGFLGKEIYTCDFEGDKDSAFENYTIEKVGESNALKIEGASAIAVTGSILENSENVAISADFKQTNCSAATTGVISMGRLNYSGSNADRLCYIDVMNNADNPVNKNNCFAFATSKINSVDLSQNFDYKSFSNPTDIYNTTDRSTDWFKMTMCYVGERVLCFADKLNGTSIWKTEQKSNSDIYLFDSMKYKSKGIFFASHCSDVYLDNIEAYEIMNISSLDINIPEKMMVGKWYDFDVTAIDKNLKVHTIDTNKLTFDYDESSLQIEGSKIKVLNLGATYIRAVLKDDIMSSETVGGVRVCGIEAADELSVSANKYVYLKDEPIEITVNAQSNSKWFEAKGYDLYCDDVKCENLNNIQSGHHTIKVVYGGIEAETEIYVSKYKKLTCSFSNTAPSVNDSLTFTIYGDDGSGAAEITDYTVSYNKNAMQIDGNTITMKKAGVYKIDVKADSAEAQFEIECLAEDGAILTEYFENSSDKNGYAPYEDNNIVTENDNKVLSLENSTTDIFGGKKWKNYTVSGRFKIENGSVDKNAYASGLEIVTRSNDASVLGSAHRNIRFIYNTDESKSSIRIGTIYGGETQAESYGWHNFEVSVSGYTAVFKVDGYEMMSSVSSSTEGGFYFLANNCRVSIDDLVFYKHTNESGDIKPYAVQTALNPYETYRVCDIAALRVGSNTFVNPSQITWAVADTTKAKIENGILTFDDDIQSESITIYASYNESVYPVTLNIAKPDSGKYEYTLSSVRVRQQSLAYKLSEDCDRSTINLATENLSYMHMLYAKMLIYPKLCDYSDALRWHIHEAQYQDTIVGRAISGGDFVMLQLAMACLELKDSLQATDDAWKDVKEYLTSVEYSLEGDNLSENHMLVNYATAILASELWPDSEICSMSAQEAHSQFKSYFKNWYNNHISQGTEYVQKNFVNDGMCADFCIHDTDGHNPHAHIMLTVRPLDENGKWQNKTEKEYLCIKDSEERGFTSAEFKTAQVDGWEKQYQYVVGKKKVYMSPSQAKQHGYERASKYPKSTRYGRQNPIAERWNSEEQLLIWRKNWADINNLYLARKNIDSRIDHRSHKERGLDEQPTIHEGVTAIIIEQKGGTSERCEINRQIKADNKLFRELKETLKKLAQAVIDTLPKLADTLETIRKNIMIAAYHMLHSRYRKEAVGDKIKTTADNIQKYENTLSRLKAKVKDKKATAEQKKTTSFLNIPKQHELTKLLNTQTEEIEELKTEKSMLLNKLNCENSSEVATLKNRISNIAATVSVIVLSLVSLIALFVLITVTIRGTAVFFLEFFIKVSHTFVAYNFCNCIYRVIGLSQKNFRLRYTYIVKIVCK